MGSVGLRPIERQTLWDRAYAELREALLAGRFEPGQRLVLREIAAELGISLTPVRDAVNHLVAERILERGTGGQGGGATVPHVAPDQFRQLVIMRSELESRAAYEAARVATADEVARLRAYVDEMRRTIEHERREGYLEAHRQFHFGIYALAGMPLLVDAIENLWLRCGPVLNVLLPEYVPHLKRADHHAAALAALAQNDAIAAAAAVRRDIAEAGEYIEALLGERPHPTR